VNRNDIAHLIVKRLEAEKNGAARQFASQRYFVVDDLLPPGLAADIYRSFPDPAGMMLRKSIRELKYVTSQMDRCEGLLEEVVYAFQRPSRGESS
jgi:hypothetical protein